MGTVIFISVGFGSRWNDLSRRYFPFIRLALDTGFNSGRAQALCPPSTTTVFDERQTHVRSS